MPFLSVVAVVRRVFCRIKSSLKLFFFKKYNQGIFFAGEAVCRVTC